MPSLPIAHNAPWLAPLAGFSDLPFRLLCRELGAAVAMTEMVSAKGLFYDSRNTKRLLATLPPDSPLVVQLFGADPDYLSRAVTALSGEGYGFFDLNCGCSVRKVVKTGAGAALLGDPDKLVACARAMVEAAGDAHVGVKLRLGPKPPDFCALALRDRLTEAGVAWLTLHPRHASQGFSGRADWDSLAAFTADAKVPVLASGDLMTAGDGADCLARTGAAGLMYARGALADPRIFTRHANRLRSAQGLPELPLPPICDVIRRHAALCRGYADDRRALLRMRTAVPRYLRDLPGCRALRDRLCHCTSWEELDAIIDAAEGLSHETAATSGDAL
ncbi:dihydrouridine synthase DuS [Solidesulfovibrio fructosivorans JJ]]|uniref:tRNA-dihydrouridine synthase n=1 Tax=Solidesulfovibrio fructosivorans JJ] TaxID=596151 RepID=E1JW09_SOLFR|nr:tRNA-dihydrouridine synthase family protein [Solidesulfovibrio fructosivorans]EFL51369.1 dihydrouridine synthase DuS [Solidesulfovibrio fructosivorans JJ]]